MYVVVMSCVRGLLGMCVLADVVVFDNVFLLLRRRRLELFLYHATLCIQYYTMLRYAALRCAALRCAALRCAALRYAALRCAALRCAALRSGATLYQTVPYHATLYDTVTLIIDFAKALRTGTL